MWKKIVRRARRDNRRRVKEGRFFFFSLFPLRRYIIFIIHVALYVIGMPAPSEFLTLECSGVGTPFFLFFITTIIIVPQLLYYTLVRVRLAEKIHRRNTSNRLCLYVFYIAIAIAYGFKAESEGPREIHF